MSTTTTSAAPAKTGASAPSQGGVLDGLNPSHYNPKNPLSLLIIQVGLHETSSFTVCIWRANLFGDRWPLSL